MVNVIEKVIIYALVPILIIWMWSVVPPIVIENKVEIIAGVENLATMLGAVNSFFPVGVFFQCLIVWVLVYNVQLLMRFAVWLTRKLPLGIG